MPDPTAAPTDRLPGPVPGRLLAALSGAAPAGAAVPAPARHLASHWRLFLLRGMAGIVFGAVAFAVPGLGAALALGLLAAWLAVEGACTLAQAAAAPRARHDLWFWLDGIASLALALVVVVMPAASAAALVLLVGAWSLATGLFELAAAWRTRSALLGLAGALSAAFGFYLVLAPGAGLLVLLWTAAAQALVFGGLLVWLGWRLRAVARGA